ncbi:MAG: GntR family transcriptional regulator [Actinomycetota bacterium]|nr:GntR family transcriptional regulator [Actinomycetota bacterium]
MEAEGQVAYQPHRGYTVVELSLEELEEIYLIRSLLETEATRWAVPKVDAELIQRLEALTAHMDELVKADDFSRYVEANRDFHFTLFERARLPRLYRMIEVLWQVSEAYRSAISDSTWGERAQKYHRALLEACKAKDVTEAIAIQDEHRSDAIVNITAFLKKAET